MSPATVPGIRGLLIQPGRSGRGQRAEMNAIVADVDHRLPRLAWLVDLAASRPRIFCGADVEVFADGLFEGCWDGAFESGGFDRPHQLFGSGFRIHADEILFLTPSHTLDALFVLGRGGAFVVANSLPFLVQYAGLELPFDLAIGFRFASVKKGVAAYERLLFTGAGGLLHRITFENFVIGREGLRAVAKPAEPDFTDYAGYRSFLHGVLGR